MARPRMHGAGDYERLRDTLEQPARRTVNPAPPPRERFAVLGNIHGCLELLDGALALLERDYGIGPDRVVCIGDLLGWGPDPEACIDIAQHFRVCVAGAYDHEIAGLNGRGDFETYSNYSTVDVCRTVKERLRPGPDASPEQIRRWRFLRQLPAVVVDRPYVFGHGMLDAAWAGPVGAFGTQAREHIDRVFREIPELGFGGRCYQPYVVPDPSVCVTPPHGNDDVFVRRNISDGGQYRWSDGIRLFVCPGSLYPRPASLDRLSRLVVVDPLTRTLEFRRFRADLDALVAKLRAVPGMPEFQIDRLSPP